MIKFCYKMYSLCKNNTISKNLVSYLSFEQITSLSLP